MRLFAGIALDDRWHRALMRVRETVIDADPTWRGEKWVAEGNHHVTLGFFGEVSEGDMGPLRDSLHSQLAGHCEFHLPLAGIVRAVPNPRHARMLWTTLEDPEHMGADLASAVMSAASTVGVPPERRPYRPHITLARARKARRILLDSIDTDCCLRELGGEASVSVLAATLYRSRLSSAGATYEILDEFYLGK